MACAASTEHGSAAEPAELDPRRPYRLNPDVALRPESFGALAYDFGTRRLSFLKSRALVAVVRELADQSDVYGALTAAEVPESEHRRYLTALAGLLETGTIQPRG